MNFFELTHPPYKTDQEHMKQNPVISSTKNPVYLPGIICSVCGSWASSKRIRVDDKLVEKVKSYLGTNNILDELPYHIWEKVILEISNFMGLPFAELQPGALLGKPEGDLLNNPKHNILHPFPGQVWVDKKVATVIQEENLNGVKLEKVHLNQKKLKMMGNGEGTAELFELVITRSCWRIGSSLEEITACKECFRKEFPNPNNLKVDLQRWDGSDFFNLDYNPNIILVSERVHQIFSEYSFTNYSLVPK